MGIATTFNSLSFYLIWAHLKILPPCERNAISIFISGPAKKKKRELIVANI